MTCLRVKNDRRPDRPRMLSACRCAPEDDGFPAYVAASSMSAIRLGIPARDDDSWLGLPAAGSGSSCDAQQRIGVGGEIDSHDLRLLVGDMIDEAGVLMAEAVVILPPDMRSQQIVERSDRAPPRDLVGALQPFGVLIEHGVDDMDEGLVAGEKSVAPGQQISFEPALAGVLLGSPSPAPETKDRRPPATPPPTLRPRRHQQLLPPIFLLSGRRRGNSGSSRSRASRRAKSRPRCARPRRPRLRDA